jgi:hypothetical protein
LRLRCSHALVNAQGHANCRVLCFLLLGASWSNLFGDTIDIAFCSGNPIPTATSSPDSQSCLGGFVGNQYVQPTQSFTDGGAPSETNPFADPIPFGTKATDNISWTGTGSANGFSFTGTLDNIRAAYSSLTGGTTAGMNLTGTLDDSTGAAGVVSISIEQQFSGLSQFYSQNVVPATETLSGSCNLAAANTGAFVTGLAGFFGPSNVTQPCPTGGGNFTSGQVSNSRGYALSGNYNLNAEFAFGNAKGSDENISIPLSGTLTVPGPLNTAPEPASLPVLALGLAAMVGFLSRRAAAR